MQAGNLSLAIASPNERLTRGSVGFLMRAYESRRMIAMLGASAITFSALAANARKASAATTLQAAGSAQDQPMPHSMITGSIASAMRPSPDQFEPEGRARRPFQQGPRQAIAIRNGMGEGTLDRHILTWAIAVSGQKGVPSYEIAARPTGIEGLAGPSHAARQFRARALP